MLYWFKYSSRCIDRHVLKTYIYIYINKNQLKEVDTPQSLQKTHGNIQPFFFKFFLTPKLCIFGHTGVCGASEADGEASGWTSEGSLPGNPRDALVDSEKDI